MTLMGGTIRNTSFENGKSCFQKKDDFFGRFSGNYSMQGTRIVMYSILDYENTGAIAAENQEGPDSPFT